MAPSTSNAIAASPSTPRRADRGRAGRAADGGSPGRAATAGRKRHLQQQRAPIGRAQRRVDRDDRRAREVEAGGHAQSQAGRGGVPKSEAGLRTDGPAPPARWVPSRSTARQMTPPTQESMRAGGSPSRDAGVPRPASAPACPSRAVPTAAVTAPTANTTCAPLSGGRRPREGQQDKEESGLAQSPPHGVPGTGQLVPGEPAGQHLVRGAGPRSRSGLRRRRSVPPLGGVAGRPRHRCQAADELGAQDEGEPQEQEPPQPGLRGSRSRFANPTACTSVSTPKTKKPEVRCRSSLERVSHRTR